MLIDKLATQAMKYKIWATLAIGVLTVLVAYIDYLVPQEVPVDILYLVPIWCATYIFGWRGAMAFSSIALLLFIFANYVLPGQLPINRQEFWFAIFLTAILLYGMGWSSYIFKLSQTKSHALHQQSLQLAVTFERNRLAREIHDVLAQGLTGILFQVEAARLNVTHPSQLEERLGQIEQLARYNLQEARRSVANLRPLPLDGINLIEALKQKLNSFGQESGVETEFEVSGQPRELPSEVETALFRVTQEALNNVARHAKATKATVSLDYDEQEICLTISDDGQGFQPDLLAATTSFGTNADRQAAADNGGDTAPGNHPKFGLTTMQERARLIGGLLHIESQAPTVPPKKVAQGSRVRLIVPYDKMNIPAK